MLIYFSYNSLNGNPDNINAINIILFPSSIYYNSLLIPHDINYMFYSKDYMNLPYYFSDITVLFLF